MLSRIGLICSLSAIVMAYGSVAYGQQAVCEADETAEAAVEAPSDGCQGVGATQQSVPRHARRASRTRLREQCPAPVEQDLGDDGGGSCRGESHADITAGEVPAPRAACPLPGDGQRDGAIEPSDGVQAARPGVLPGTKGMVQPVGSQASDVPGLGPQAIYSLPFAIQTERLSGGLMAAGIVFIPIGAIGMIGGMVSYIASEDDTCGVDSYSYGSSSCGEEDSPNLGPAFMAVGGMMMVGGIVMTAVGAQKVPLISGKQASAVPTLSVGVGQATLRWSF
jgi:hypothetical protein